MKNTQTKTRHIFSLLASTTVVGISVFLVYQLVFSPIAVQTVYAGSTLTPTPNAADPLPTDTPVPAATNTPVPAPTNTPVPPPTNTPSSGGGVVDSSPAPTNTPVPVLPTEIPDLGVGGPRWQPILLIVVVMLMASSFAVFQLKAILKTEVAAKGKKDEEI